MKKSKNGDSGLECNEYGFPDTSSEDVTEDEILDYLAEIIADIYLDEEKKK